MAEIFVGKATVSFLVAVTIPIATLAIGPSPIALYHGHDDGISEAWFATIRSHKGVA